MKASTQAGLLALVILRSVQAAPAQQPERTHALKIYTNVEPQLMGGASIGRISPAFMWSSNKGVFQEVELSALDYQDENGYNPGPHFELAARYEVGYVLRYKRVGRFKTSLGLAVGSGMMHYWWPATSTYEAGNTSLYEASLGVAPRFMISQSKRLFVDLNVVLPVVIWQYHYIPSLASTFPAYRPASLHFARWGGMIDGFFDNDDNDTRLRLGIGVRL